MGALSRAGFLWASGRVWRGRGAAQHVLARPEQQNSEGVGQRSLTVPAGATNRGSQNGARTAEIRTRSRGREGTQPLLPFRRSASRA